MVPGSRIIGTREGIHIGVVNAPVCNVEVESPNCDARGVRGD